MSGRRPLDARLHGSRDARQGIRNSNGQGPRLRFYTVYDREAAVFDDKFADDCHTNLSDVLLFAGLLSTVNSTLALEASSYAERNTGAETSDFLRAIIYTLNPSHIPEGDKIYVPPVWEGPTRRGRIASDLLYASFLLTIFTSFLATLAKQWLVWYLKNSGVSVTARCRERQRKRDSFDRWLFQTFVDALPLLLQVSLVLLGAGLIAFITAYSLTSAEVVVAFTALGAGIYIVFTIPGILSRHSPFQTPISIYFRTSLGNILLYFPSLQGKFISARKKLSRWIHLSNLQRLLPLSIQEVDFYLGNFSTPNTDDAHCVSWVLKNITNPEAIDEALRLAGVVRWFEDGCNSDPPYDYIVSIFKSCFDFSGSLDQQSKERASYSATAILQVHISALLHRPDENASKYPIPRVTADRSKMSGELKSVLDLLASMDGEPSPLLLFAKDPKRALWTSELLLWYTTNKNFNMTAYSSLIRKGDALHYPWWHEFPPEVVNNFLSVWCVYLGWEMDKKTPKIQKSNSMEETLEQLSTLVLGAIPIYDPRRPFLFHLLNGLTKWKDRPLSLSHMAFDWCTAICEGIGDDEYCTSLIFPALNVGFRHSTPGFTNLVVNCGPTVHQRMVKLVFTFGDHETVADALCAWISVEDIGHCVQLLNPCVEPLVAKLVHAADAEIPPRLRRAIIHAINLIDFVERVGIEWLTALLVLLEVGIDDIMDARDHWTSLILRIILSEVGRGHMSLWYWELLVKLVGGSSKELPALSNKAVLDSLLEKEEWEKLACWLGVVWCMRSPSAGGLPVEVVTNATAALLNQIPTALQGLEELVADSAEGSFGRMHEDAFEQVCGHEVRTESHLTISQAAEFSTELQAPESAPSHATHSRRTSHSHRAAHPHYVPPPDLSDNTSSTQDSNSSFQSQPPTPVSPQFSNDT